MAAWVAPSLADRGDALELEVKATYLYKFPPFIVWPTDAFRSPASPFSLCIVGNDPFGGLIDRAVAGQRMANRRVAVVRLDAAAHDSPCQLMYIAPGSQPLQQTLKAVEGEPILTVTDSAADGSKGIINFIVRDNHVRFEIDQAAAGRNRLEISSKLLSVAVSVTPK
jgi:hypothetical protein